MLDLEPIKARMREATMGPWSAPGMTTQSDIGREYLILDYQRNGAGLIGQAPELADAAFIAEARADVPALVAEVARLRAAITKHRDDCRREYGIRPEDHSDQDAALWATLD